MYQSRRVRIAQLKDHLSEHLRAVEAGAEVIVTDRDRPIARILPMPSGGARPEIVGPVRDFAEVRDRPRSSVLLDVSSTELLLSERGERGRLRR